MLDLVFKNKVRGFVEDGTENFLLNLKITYILCINKFELYININNNICSNIKSEPMNIY